jgi:hypothetical protein
MDAWIDCLTYVDEPDLGMIAPQWGVSTGDVLTLQIHDVRAFAQRYPEQCAALIECSAFVNWRRLDIGHRSILAISFVMSEPVPGE